MSVNHISQSHAHEAEAVQNVNSQKSPVATTKATTKANAVDGPSNSNAHPDSATAQTKQPPKTDNNAGHEQGRQENTGSDTNGTRVNVFA